MSGKNGAKKIIIANIIVVVIIFCMGVYYSKQYNSKTKLDIVSSYGDNEAYHPKVLEFSEKWNGYKYWMGFTPYLQGDQSKENPHIVVSNNLIDWKTPNGLKNPLDICDDEGKQKATKKYNSDVHLVYNYDLDRLECYWRYVDEVDNKIIIYRRWSTDGINFSEKEEFIKSDDKNEQDYVSPAIIYENKTYKMWYVDKKQVKYKEMKNDGIWSEEVTTDVAYKKEDLKTWHLDVILTEKGYEMVTCAYQNGGKRDSMSLYYTYSEKETSNWSVPEKILSPTKGTAYWDNQGLYRSCLVYEDGVYILFYSGFGTKYDHGIGIVYGKDIKKLKGANIDFFKEKESEQLMELIKEEKSK